MQGQDCHLFAQQEEHSLLVVEENRASQWFSLSYQEAS